MERAPNKWHRDDRYRSSFVLGLVVGLMAMWCLALLLNIFQVVQQGPAVAAAIASAVTALVALATIVHQSRMAAVRSEEEEAKRRAQVAYECLPELYLRGRAICDAVEGMSDLFRVQNFSSESVLVSTELRDKIHLLNDLPEHALKSVTHNLSAIEDPGPRLVLSAYRPTDQTFEFKKKQILSMPETGAWMHPFKMWEAMHSFVLDLLATLTAIRVLEGLGLTYQGDLDDDVRWIIHFLYDDVREAFRARKEAATNDSTAVFDMELHRAISCAVKASNSDPKIFVDRNTGWVDPPD